MQFLGAASFKCEQQGGNLKIFLLFFSVLFSSYTVACTCVTPSVEEAFNSADYVYIGQIESSKLVNEKDVVNYLTIVKEFKGARNTDILMSKVDESSCASPATVGYRYVVFGNFGKAPELLLCNQSQILFGGKKPLLDELNELAVKN